MRRIRSFVRVHGRSSLAVGALVVALLAGGSAWALTSGGSGSASRLHPVGAVSSGGGSHYGHKGHHHGRRHAIGGTIRAINGATWTLQTKRGGVLEVKLAPTTAFGSLRSPSSKGQFSVGMSVRVIGTRSGKTVTARRIVARKPGTGASAG
ncbi:MAG: hypothetical protein M0Z69_06975 [Actinomycetota bacterium]|nr:hypothetical protein [Actinomycetota bacterium]